MRFLIWLLIGYCAYLFFKGRSGNKLPSATSNGSETETHKDPVCGVYVAGDDAVVGSLEGQKIYFCSMACLQKYQDQLSDKP